jgi:hypothetical protein
MNLDGLHLVIFSPIHDLITINSLVKADLTTACGLLPFPLREGSVITPPIIRELNCIQYSVQNWETKEILNIITAYQPVVKHVQGFFLGNSTAISNN